MTKNEWIAFLLFNILDHLFILQIFWKNPFKNLLQIVKGIGLRLQEAFLRFEISPRISNAFPLTK
jgi:hypothetical protein